MEPKSHYNARPNTQIADRTKSPILGLRKYNNWVKATVIQKYVKPGFKVLDLGCGKGGDLIKFQKAKVSVYLGVDIADVSIQHAKDRFKGGFHAQFMVLDCFNQPLNLSSQFDFVNAQFCIHYAFSSDESVNMLLRNVSNNLRKGGLFVASFPDKSRLINKGLEFGNSLYHVKFETQEKYWFTLTDAIQECPEYLVDMQKLVNLAKEYGLHLKEECNLYNDFYRTKNPLWYKMQVQPLSSDEVEVVQLYSLCTFYKE